LVLLPCHMEEKENTARERPMMTLGDMEVCRKEGIAWRHFDRWDMATHPYPFSNSATFTFPLNHLDPLV